VLWGIFLTVAIVTVVAKSEPSWLVLAGGVLVWLVRCKPKFSLNKTVALAPLPMQETAILLHQDWGMLTQIFWFFAKAGTFVFGSGLAIIPFLYGGVVADTHWLTEKQFLDAVAVAMITPGPVVITVGFIGYLIAGFQGASVAAIATFLPCYLFTVLPAPYFKKYGKLPAIVAFVDGVTAAAIGAIAGAVIVLAQRSLTDIPTLLLAVVTTGLLWRFKKLPEPVIVLGAAGIGLVLFPLFRH
jgi:chromate transporter